MENISTRPRRALAATALGTVALVSSLALAAPAQAASTQIENFQGCSAKAYRPVFSHHNNAGTKVFNYKVSITCKGDRQVRFEQKAWERDSGPDELRAERRTGWITWGTDVFGLLEPTTKTFNYKLALHDTESGDEEIYHQIKIQVRSNGVNSSWSPLSTSGVRVVNN
jgi:hypothetical protein